MTIGREPVFCGNYDFDLPEVMYYLYLPVIMNREWRRLELPKNLPSYVAQMIYAAKYRAEQLHGWIPKYAYVSARKGWATKDNPLNRPGWHIDGYGSNDLNFVWWVGDGTRFAIQEFKDISTDHNKSLEQFEAQVDPTKIVTYPAKGLYMIDTTVVHSTPDVVVPHMRQYIKISLSEHQYNLENNSHNYAFQYDWKMHTREEVRNDPIKSQQDNA